MKFFFLLLFPLFYLSTSYGQNKLSGLWYSRDRSRIYSIHRTDSGYKANIDSSIRKGDSKGALILNQVYPSGKPNLFRGLIYATGSAEPLLAKIYLQANSSILKIKIPRMYVFPVTVYWYRKEPQAGQ